MILNTKEQYKRLIIFFEMAVIIFAEAWTFWHVWSSYYNKIIPLPYWRRGHWIVIIIYVVLIYFFSRVYGGFKIGYLRLSDIIFSQILSMFFVNAVTYLQICLIGRAIMNIRPIIYIMFIDCVLIVIWAFCSRQLYARLYPPRRMIMIYGDRESQSLIHKMSTRKDKYDIQECIHISESEDVIFEKILAYDAVLICDVPSETRNRILKYCFRHSIRVYVTPKLSDIIVLGSDNIHLFDTPLLLSRNSGLPIEQRFTKRFMDILLSLTVGIIFSPIMLIIALCIKLYDKGPVFYKQERLTLNGKRFMIYKFRSMTTDSEAKSGARLAMKNDARITPIGKFIRATHLDELPQIINILKGDMSIVGPRPERPEIAALYEEEIPEFSFRLKVKAGLTGYAQIYGKYNTTPYDKLKLDLLYIENYSIWQDLKLILMTVKTIFQKDNTEGVEEWQTNAIKKKE